MDRYEKRYRFIEDYVNSPHRLEVETSLCDVVRHVLPQTTEDNIGDISMELAGGEIWGSADMALWLGSKGEVDIPLELLDPMLKLAKDADDHFYTSGRWPGFYDDILAHQARKNTAA